MVAVEAHGQIIGFHDAGRDPWMPPGLFDLQVLVDPVWRGQGVGAALYQDALEYIQMRGATRLNGRVRDDCAPCSGFAERQGFQIDRHLFESTLGVASFDESRLAGRIEAVEAAGIRFFTLADPGNTQEAQYRLYALNNRLNRDTPSYQSWLPFEEFHPRMRCLLVSRGWTDRCS